MPILALLRDVRSPLARGLAMILVGCGLARAEEPARSPRPTFQGRLRLPDRLDNYANPVLPDHFDNDWVRRFDSTPAGNPTTDAGATLGRALFYDTRLSVDSTVSCATCHLQAKGFASPEKFSVGIEGRRGDRNAMGLANARWAAGGRFFWDERAATLEEQVLEPIKNPLEMGHDVASAVAAVGADPAYAPLFTRAFGDPKATEDRVARAMAQFIRAMVSYRSRYDEGLADAGSLLSDFGKFTPEENRGKSIFLGQADRSSRGNCATCHIRAFAFFNPANPVRQAAIFQVDRARTNGLEAEIVSGDNGVGDRTLNPRDFGRFRVPDLRNVELTAPYMHDGRFATLEDVVDFYSDGVQPHHNLDPQLIGGRPGQRNPRPRLMKLSEADKAALVAFLKTLTDHELARDPKFSDPFERGSR